MQATIENVVRLAEERHLLGPEAAAIVRGRLQVPAASRPPLIDLLGEAGAVPVESAVALLGEALALPVLAAAELAPEPAALAAVSRETAQRAGALPLARRGAVLRVAVADPFHPALEAIGQEAQAALDPVLAPAEAIRAALAIHYAPVRAPTAATAEPIGGAATAGDAAAPIARLVQHIVEEALRRRASDIHLEPRA
ncbi:MAG TPA: hypothetical protein PK322_16370, partial [Opitutaceae bacterium]|nr:hypothetical protein [Opitutaceae bacterium]